MHSGKTEQKGRRAAFTMVEIVITLALIMLMLGVTVSSMRSLSSERRLREVTAEVKDFAKKARRLAMSEQRSYQIAFLPGQFTVSGLRALSDEERAFDRVLGGSESDAIEEKRETFVYDTEFSVSFRRWNAKEWEPSKGQRWVFERSGICTPVHVRVSNEDSYIEMSFHPLTGGIEEEASEIR